MSETSEIHIKGVQKSSLIDYPGKISSVVFLSKCNFNCPFCHNPELVHDTGAFPDISLEEFSDYLEDRKKWIDAVCITGGEPTLHSGLIELMKLIKARGLFVKLDTNGTNPQVIRKALDEKCVDYIAMDIKNSLDKYEETTGRKVDKSKIEESIKLIIEAQKHGLIEAEFRSTILPRLHTAQDLEKMSEMVKGAKRYILQQFKTEEALVDMTFREEQPYTLQEMEPFKKIFEKNCEIVEVR
jgi:pyruvate formate lyase activating enzyme